MIENTIQKAVAQVLESGDSSGSKAVLFNNKKSLGEQAEEKMQKVSIPLRLAYQCPEMIKIVISSRIWYSGR